MSLKMIHTADWHLGKRLHNLDLIPYQSQFLEELLGIIEEREIDVLLVSGDIFDHANPSNQARSLYFRFIHDLSKIGCQLIVTGGNHDSPYMLNAPRELLLSMNVFVIGHVPENLEECIIPVGKEGDVQAVVAAIPYLRDQDIRTFSTAESSKDRLQEIRKGIENIFKEASSICREKYPEVPAVAMGHVYTDGSTVSDSERDIQVGNLAGVSSEVFPKEFDYVALGHIHKPQPMTTDGRVNYVGSPYPLSFSERDWKHRLVEVRIEKGRVVLDDILLKKYFMLKTLVGDMTKISSQLKELESADETLPIYLELKLEEDTFNAAIKTELNELVTAYENDYVTILKYRVHFRDQVDNLAKLYNTDTSIEELNPADVFQKKLDAGGADEEKKKQMMEAFHQIMEEIQQGGIE